MDKLHEEIIEDGQHLKHLIGICEGNALIQVDYVRPSFEVIP